MKPLTDYNYISYTALIGHQCNYADNHVFCSSYFSDVLTSKCIILTTYNNLLTDISETFGVGVVLLILTASAATTLALINACVFDAREFVKGTLSLTRLNANLGIGTTSTKITEFHDNIQVTY